MFVINLLILLTDKRGYCR